tara:strand:+ start:216 stop:2399 length:2184 start_codon:yes stop_codon:yes gene_type:complete
MSYRQNVSQQLRDAGHDDVADSIELLLSDTTPETKNAPLQITHNEANEDLPLSGYGEDSPDAISEFKEPSDPIPDPGNFPPPHKHNSDRVQNMTNGWNSDLSVYYNAPAHTHRVYDCHPQKMVRYDISSLQMSQYASNRGFSNDSSIAPPSGLAGAESSIVKYAIATDTISAISGTTLGAGPAVLAEIINGVVQPVVGDFKKKPAIGILGQQQGKGREGGKLKLPEKLGPVNGGDPVAKKNAVWTITPAGSVMGSDRPYEGKVINSAGTAGQLYPHYSFEDNGNDLSGNGLDLTASSAAYSSTSKVDSKSARFQGSSYFERAHHDIFTPSAGDGMRVSFWIRWDSLSSIVSGNYQGIITKCDLNGSTSVIDGEWGIFYKQTSGVGSAMDIAWIFKTNSATNILGGAFVSAPATLGDLQTGAWYFIDVGITDDGTCFFNVRSPDDSSAANLNTSGTYSGTPVAAASEPMRIGWNDDPSSGSASSDGKLGSNSGDVLIDSVFFTKDLTASTDTLYNMYRWPSTILPNANETLITGTYQVQDVRNVYTAVTSTSGATRPAIKITKPANSSNDIAIEVGTSTSKYMSDFTADPSVATVTQTSDPKGATVTWHGQFEGYPIDIFDTDNGYVVSSTSARASECLVKVSTIGSGAQNIGRSGETQGPQDAEGTVAAGAVVRNPHFGESADPVAKAKERGYSTGGAITVRNPTSSSYSNGTVIKVESSGNGWVIL